LQRLVAQEANGGTVQWLMPARVAVALLELRALGVRCQGGGVQHMPGKERQMQDEAHLFT
jgi:hypothetical protein